MSQLTSLSKRGLLIVLAVVMVIAFAIGYSASERMVTGQPVSSPDTAANLVVKLRDKVEKAETTKRVYIAYWSEVCDATRKLDGQYDYDIVMVDQLSRYEEMSAKYYLQLIDEERLPEVAEYVDAARGAAGRGNCDFLPIPPEIASS